MLRDLAKAYEAVRRHLLWQVATRHGYPSWLLRLSLNAYMWGRRLEMLAGMVGPMINVPKCTCSGSAHATYELKLYLLEYLCDASTRFCWLEVSIHVDDFSLFVKGDNDDECLVRLEEAADHMDVALSDLHMKQAKDKEEILATSDQLAGKAERQDQWRRKMLRGKARARLPVRRCDEVPRDVAQRMQRRAEGSAANTERHRPTQEQGCRGSRRSRKGRGTRRKHRGNGATATSHHPRSAPCGEKRRR